VRGKGGGHDKGLVRGKKNRGLEREKRGGADAHERNRIAPEKTAGIYDLWGQEGEGGEGNSQFGDTLGGKRFFLENRKEEGNSRVVWGGGENQRPWWNNWPRLETGAGLAA